MSRRAPETLADYLVVAVCPALIMLLVGSLMWFLVEVFYQGEYKLRLLWVMAMFVIAIVGIARISMEEGLAYASLFGGPLAAVIALALVQFVQDGLFIGGSLMLLVWWAAHKLTWDCTLIDDTQDASGQGLLQQMGLDPSAPHADLAPPGTTTRTGDIEAMTITDQKPQPSWWETLLEPDRRPHAPGVWVVYFSLAALPLFGIGGWFVPASDPVGRARVFGLLVLYVACGMGLLLATSFLGLRRYLRQRKLEMPLDMTSTWIIVGVVMIVAMLLAAAILPRPSREYSLSQLPFTVTSAVHRASRYALGKEGTKDDDAQNAATSDAKQGQKTDRKGGNKNASQQKSGSLSSSGQQQDNADKSSGDGKGDGRGKGSADSDKSQSSGGGKAGKDGKPQSASSNKGDKSSSRNAETQSQGKTNNDLETNDSSSAKSRSPDQQQSPDQAQQQRQLSGTNPPNSKPAAPQEQSPAPNRGSPSRILSRIPSLISQAVFALLRWLFYAALVLALVIAAIIYRGELAAAWKKLVAELQELWDAWFGKKKATSSTAGEAEPVAMPRLFASFADPFLTGDASRMSWPQLVRYTFDALEAWGREHGCPRRIGQTPHEYALAIGAAEPEIASPVQSLAGWYNQLAYAPRAAAGGSPESLRGLWHDLRARHAPAAVA